MILNGHGSQFAENPTFGSLLSDANTDHKQWSRDAGDPTSASPRKGTGVLKSIGPGAHPAFSAGGNQGHGSDFDKMCSPGLAFCAQAHGHMAHNLALGNLDMLAFQRSGWSAHEDIHNHQSDLCVRGETTPRPVPNAQLASSNVDKMSANTSEAGDQFWNRRARSERSESRTSAWPRVRVENTIPAVATGILVPERRHGYSVIGSQSEKERRLADFHDPSKNHRSNPDERVDKIFARTSEEVVQSRCHMRSEGSTTPWIHGQLEDMPVAQKGTAVRHGDAGVSKQVGKENAAAEFHSRILSNCEALEVEMLRAREKRTRRAASNTRHGTPQPRLGSNMGA
jgi:hypothetical protein